MTGISECVDYSGSAQYGFVDEGSPPYDSEMLDNILELITLKTVATKRPLICVGAEERPAEIVRSRFMKLNVEHIRYVMSWRYIKEERHSLERNSNLGIYFDRNPLL
ncbi:MAG: DUF6017 domain-containing protein [Clostridiaceae bacterium]